MTYQHIEAAIERWHRLPLDRQTLVAAGTFGAILGASFSQEAIPTQRLAEMLHTNVQAQENEWAIERAREQQARIEEADE